MQTHYGLNEDHLEPIHSIISEFAFEGCPFSDDSSSSKKSHPGAFLGDRDCLGPTKALSLGSLV